jgi:hypothetical protein
MDLRDIARTLLAFRVEANGQHLLTWGNVVTDREIRLLWDGDAIEPGELFLPGLFDGSGRTFSKADKNLSRRKHRRGEAGEGCNSEARFCAKQTRRSPRRSVGFRPLERGAFIGAATSGACRAVAREERAGESKW